MMAPMMLAIAAQVLPGGKGAEPAADEIIQAAGAEERIMGGVVHENGERKMAASEENQGDEYGPERRVQGHEPE